jgi:prephenate dehydrogenase
MGPEAPFRRIAIVGTGLIGGSFGLATRAAFPETIITGWDHPEVLARAVARGAIAQTSESLSEVVAAADLVYVALPIGATISLLPEIAQAARPDTLVTDSGSTKASICHAAAEQFRNGGCFLGGHPIAGREAGGIENADAGLFRGAKYALVGDEREARCEKFAALLGAIGAEPVWLDAETHDWALGIVSHLPQLVSVALAGIVHDETDETGLPLSLAGAGLRDVLRLTGSPYAVWRDICLTNVENITRSLDRMAQAIEHLRRGLASRELERHFGAANEVYKSLHQVD